MAGVETAPAIIEAKIPNNIKLATPLRILESVLLEPTETEIKRQKQCNFLFGTIDALLVDAIEGNIHQRNTVEADGEVEQIMALVTQAKTTSPQVPEEQYWALMEAVKSPYPKVKAAAIEGLVQLAPASVDAIIERFDPDADQDLRAGLVEACMHIGHPRTLFLLEKVIGFEIADHCQGKIRRVAARGLGKIGRQARDPEVISQGIEKLRWTLLEPDDWGLRL